MINSKTLRRAVGISQDDVSGNASPNVPSINQQSVIVGRFKRGRTDKPFKVNSKNFKALLGDDQTNPSFLAIQDAFDAGADFLWVMRIGKPIARLSDGSQVDDEKKYEEIALESNLYPIPVFRGDIYQPAIRTLDSELRSSVSKPADIVDAYWSSIKHFDIKRASDGKSFDFEAAYTSRYEVLSAHLGSVLKQPKSLNDGYGASVELGPLALRYGQKKIDNSDGYIPLIEHLSAQWVSKFKYKSVNSAYMPAPIALDLKLARALEVLNPHIGTDGYSGKITLLNLSLGNGLITATAYNPAAYEPKAEALNAKLTRALDTVRLTANDGYLPAIEPLSMVMTSKALLGYGDSAYSQTLTVLDAVSSFKLAGGEVFELSQAYQSNVEILELVLYRFKVHKPLINNGYTPTVQILNVSTTQRIK